MLPPGHIAAGYLTAKALLHFSHLNLTPVQSQQLIWWGMFWGFVPDLDSFYWFLKSKALKFDVRQGSHRYYITHAPALWLLAGLVIFFSSASAYWKLFGLLVWLGSWSHFLLDSIQFGVMWLWPLNRKVYALWPVNDQARMEQGMDKALDKNFFRYWLTFLKEYSRSLGLTVIFELILLAVALIIYIK